MAIETMPGKLLKVTVHGATITSILYTVTAGGAPCDGLLFGETVATTTQHLRDDDDTATVTESRAAVTAATCCASTCSFYDDAGELLESALHDLTRQQPAPLLGWLSYRPAAAAGPLRPTMRESAVTQAVLRRQLARHGGRQAALLMLVSTGGDHNGATLTWQCRCFQARLSKATGEMLLEAVELQTLNLGGHTGQAAYQQLSPAAALSPACNTSGPAAALQQQMLQISFSAAAAPAPGCAVPQPPPLAAEGPYGASFALPGHDLAALAALAAGARGQVTAVKQHCEALLAGLQELCCQAVAGEAAVAALRHRRDTLLAQLARTY